MNPKQLGRLRALIMALHIQLERLEWEDWEEKFLGPDETDFSFDLDQEDCFVDDDDLPDETDFGPIGPLCVECGNFGRSCVC